MSESTTIPVLNLSLARSPTTKPQFLSKLRDALVRVGFFYLENHPVPEQVQQEAMQESRHLFALPLQKCEVDIVNRRHFFGHIRTGSEVTNGGAAGLYCLEVQTQAGVWIAAPPLPGTLVLNIGRMLECSTHGVCAATTIDSTVGNYLFLAYLTGFPDVAARWYPALLSRAVNKQLELQVLGH
ncbi:uncharacterized protein DSM5745_11123 [Aspergillus mulundensis]|uniref:Non-haem dioxygenase N-terminal domain-containing protein n=1 Tax=Aspergillus mulundensis TaxID=1810919 RepID=A0A3D8QB45_9EURO|nr:hypothetical protein DSM5745_11123 [Aspergillus mulundensis]RDW58917.1 hypothetical protein DSM5745_11123 [Aspergillus mulundensis]